MVTQSSTPSSATSHPVVEYGVPSPLSSLPPSSPMPDKRDPSQPLMTPLTQQSLSTRTTSSPLSLVATPPPTIGVSFLPPSPASAGSPPDQLSPCLLSLDFAHHPPHIPPATARFGGGSLNGIVKTEDNCALILRWYQKTVVAREVGIIDDGDDIGFITLYSLSSMFGGAYL
ncbi:hypothetical protein BDQ12DRAFT_729765 [Crucibulum laeve]|uniref:Uncharacterized protein n=1 Tax=Crucibulum laeve TaxID=68775 RepID=A0A5C3LEX7_9AGAR|nr:hypothetical protein BDQ12DRAFT_729765 [Crucibulum laeve]